MTKRIILLVTSPRMPAGLMTAEAWDLVRGNPVLAEKDSDLTTALRATGVAVELVAPDPETLLAKANPAAVWLSGPSGDESLARALGMRLVREPRSSANAAELELMYGSWDPPGARLLDAVAVMDRLHVEDPWKREQTHRTLAKYLLEEAYEAYDSILEDDYEALRGEMGDVLLQVLLHARLAEELPEEQRWNIDDVAGDFVAKMVRRNPHVFGDVQVKDTAEVIENWERIKREEGPSRITWSLPALVLANKLLSRLDRPVPDDETLGTRILRLLADEPDVDAEASLREALRRYAG